MKFSVSTRSRLLKATKTLSRIGIKVETDSIADQTTLRQIEKLRDLDPEGADDLIDVVRSISAFNEVASAQVGNMRVGERFEIIRKNFQSIIADTEKMVKRATEQRKALRLLDSVRGRLSKVHRGTIDGRFQEIRNLSEQVFSDAQDQVEREHCVLDAYREFRLSLKQAVLTAESIHEKAQGALDEVRARAPDNLDDAEMSSSTQVTVSDNTIDIERDVWEDEVRVAKERLDVASNIKANLRVMLGVCEGVMTRYAQTAQVKEALLRNSATFYTTNKGAMDVLNLAINQQRGLNEQSEQIRELSRGIDQAINKMSKIGTKVQDKAVEAAYQSGISPDTIKTLYNEVVQFKEHQQSMIENFRAQQEKNYKEIRAAVEDGNRRLAMAHQADTRKEIQAAKRQKRLAAAKESPKEIQAQDVEFHEPDQVTPAADIDKDALSASPSV